MGFGDWGLGLGLQEGNLYLGSFSSPPDMAPITTLRNVIRRPTGDYTLVDYQPVVAFYH